MAGGGVVAGKPKSSTLGVEKIDRRQRFLSRRPALGNNNAS